MRYDTPVYFQTVKAGPYDPDSGDYGEDTITEEKRDASVTDAGIDTLNLVYGTIRQGVKVVRLQNHYDKPFSSLKIGDKVYRVDRARRLRTKHILVCSEVQ